MDCVVLLLIRLVYSLVVKFVATISLYIISQIDYASFVEDALGFRLFFLDYSYQRFIYLQSLTYWQLEKYDQPLR